VERVRAGQRPGPWAAAPEWHGRVKIYLLRTIRRRMRQQAACSGSWGAGCRWPARLAGRRHWRRYSRRPGGPGCLFHLPGVTHMAWSRSAALAQPGMAGRPLRRRPRAREGLAGLSAV